MKILSQYRNRSKGYWMCALFVLPFWTLVMCSCSSGEILTSEHGTVIHYDAQSVTVQYDTFRKQKKNGAYVYKPLKQKALNAFYLPSGHRLQIGDVY